MQRLAIIAAASVAALSTGVAHAEYAHDRDRDRDHDLSSRVRLAEVSADPRDGADTIALHGMRGFTHLELRAREALVDIHGLGLRFRDGRTEWLDLRARIAPGDQRTIELPADGRGAEALVVDYGDPALRRTDRTPARLELYGAALDARGDQRDRFGSWSYDRDVRPADRWYQRDAISMRPRSAARPRTWMRSYRE